MTRSKFSAAELTAINRFCKENNAVPQLSTPPFVKIRFKVKGSTDYIEKTLVELVYQDKISREEESKDRANEKNRQKRDEKYKPRGAI